MGRREQGCEWELVLRMGREMHHTADEALAQIVELGTAVQQSRLCCDRSQPFDLTIPTMAFM